MRVVNVTQSLATSPSGQATNQRYPQSTLDMIEPELLETLSNIIAELDTLVDQSVNDQTPARQLAERLSTQLGEVSGAFTMLELPVATALADQLREAVGQVCESDRAICEKEHQALFKSAYLLPRFFEYVCDTGITSSLLLAPCFYSLASAGLSPFVSESELAGFDFQPQVDSEEADALGGPVALGSEEELALTFRRLRHMYQTALVGMLRDEDVSSKLTLIERVAERCVGLCAANRQGLVWRLLARLLAAIRSGDLELTAQRRHFFARFDRSLKLLVKDTAAGLSALPDAAVMRELAFLLVLADPDCANHEDLQACGQFAPIHWRDVELVKHREAMERSTHKALRTMLEAIREELDAAKRGLDLMSESGLCNEEDVAQLAEACDRIASVLSMGGFDAAAQAIRESLDNIANWTSCAPEDEDLLAVANMMLFVESTLLTGGFVDQGMPEDQQHTVAKGLLQQAQQDLFDEARANIGLAKRAVNAYIESSHEREHIANMNSCLLAIAGAFEMVEIDNACGLMKSCARLLEAIYQNEQDVDEALLDNLADALVTTEYLLEELAVGRGQDASLAQLLDENLAVLAAA